MKNFFLAGNNYINLLNGLNIPLIFLSLLAILSLISASNDVWHWYIIFGSFAAFAGAFLFNVYQKLTGYKGSGVEALKECFRTWLAGLFGGLLYFLMSRFLNAWAILFIGLAIEAVTVYLWKKGIKLNL